MASVLSASDTLPFSKKIDDDFNLGIKTVHMARFVVHGVGDELNAFDADGSHLLLS
jgi:hypothetical protein